MIKRNQGGQFVKGQKPIAGFKKGSRLRLGIKHTSETIEKMKKNCGHPCSEETRRKISNSLRGKRTKENNPLWKGGRYTNKSGYVSVLIDGKYQLEHRYLVENLLGRKLKTFEHIHHLNGIKDDNRLENLKLVINRKHYGKIKCPKCEYDFLIK